MSPPEAGSGYFVPPGPGPGPGVLLLHSWWGLTPFFRDRAERLADLGFSVLVPDLLPGAAPQTSAEAEVVLGEADMDATAALVVSSVHALRSMTAAPRDPVGVVGFAMGASWAMWLAARVPESVGAVVGFYGVQHVDFDTTRADLQLHLAGADEVVSDDEVAEMRGLLGLAGRSVEIHTYPGARHGFAEPATGAAYDEVSGTLAWERAEAFLVSRLRTA